MSRSWMIYGANGYTGELTAELAHERGHAPILAGRSREKVEPIAARLGLESCVFSLDDPSQVRDALAGVDAVLHAAGPFSATSRPMVDGCLASRTHYLDVTGEIDVFEAIHARDAEAREAGVSLIPGVGLDVVPTDCLAAMLAEQLPDAVELELALTSLGASSPGTTKTMIEGLPRGGRVRRDGRIVQVPALHRQRRVAFFDKEREVVAVPWGDVSTAFYSTGIPNIVTYMALPRRAVRAGQVLSAVAPLLGSAPVQRGLKKLVDLAVAGPDDATRRRGRSEVWGQVTNERGAWVRGTLSGPEGYSFTADSAIRAIERVLDGVPPGALTPSKAFGADFVSSLDGVTVHPFER